VRQVEQWWNTDDQSCLVSDRRPLSLVIGRALVVVRRRGLDAPCTAYPRCSTFLGSARGARKKNSDRWNNVLAQRPENRGFWHIDLTTALRSTAVGAVVLGCFHDCSTEHARGKDRGARGGARQHKKDDAAVLSVSSRFHEKRFLGRNSEILSTPIQRDRRDFSIWTIARGDRTGLLVTTALRSTAVGAVTLRSAGREGHYRLPLSRRPGDCAQLLLGCLSVVCKVDGQDAREPQG